MSKLSIFVTEKMVANNQTQFSFGKEERQQLLQAGKVACGVEKAHLGKKPGNIQFKLQVTTPKGNPLTLNLRDVCLHVAHQEGEDKKALEAIWNFLAQPNQVGKSLQLEVTGWEAEIVEGTGTTGGIVAAEDCPF